jgi:hypothetical protein
MPERVKKLEGQVQALHVDLEELTGTIRKLLNIESSVPSSSDQSVLGRYVI